ncbi:CoA ester lyase [Salinarchaeum sp. IM2453]|uniref:HpcH/HpaI aldolase/citrate lyase family protein n=1 Tax=Salinarchaeum sp. IM2453 TaxID=2862870 RepID=UPI001C829CAB|nr:CoA ester lyase [Salinarchaeum sp. IM2453]QZA88269.1 CoA ester lyase [Salinarchaeum sp. IM2453]
MQPIRSALYVPGNREEWIRSAHQHGSDAIILDLEDAVPPAEKQQARDTLEDTIPTLQDKGQRIFVRINGTPESSLEVTADLESVLPLEVEALLVPEVSSPDEIARLETIMKHIERRENLSPTELAVLIETAEGMKQTYEICKESNRIGAIACGAVKGADTARSLGFEWTGPGREGLETLHLREKVLMDAKAAGVQYPLSGPYVDIDDIDGLQQDMNFAREIGYTGYTIIHPSHVEPANDIFLPEEETVEYWIGAYQALSAAISEGKSAVRYNGDMIDTATMKTAKQQLQRAAMFEHELDLDREIPDMETVEQQIS